MEIVGIDLSGPASPENTAVTRFSTDDGQLVCESLTFGATDVEIVESLVPPDAVIGIDAPLSYCPTGGSRTSDTLLREQVVPIGLPPGSVMAPSAPRMSYLTLRGISLTRMLVEWRPTAQIVEVHPASAFALRGAEIDDVRALKKSSEARTRLLGWLKNRGLNGIESTAAESDHMIAACAAALSAWKWSLDDCEWVYRAEPPDHPFDFAC